MSHLQIVVVQGYKSMLHTWPIQRLLKITLGQAKLIYSLSSGLFLKCMRAGGHFSFLIISFGPAHVVTDTII